MQFRVHAREIHLIHADVTASSGEQAEEILKSAFKTGIWGPKSVMVIEFPGYGLEIEEEKTRKLIPSDRRMGESAKEHYKLGGRA